MNETKMLLLRQSKLGKHTGVIVTIVIGEKSLESSSITITPLTPYTNVRGLLTIKYEEFIKYAAQYSQTLAELVKSRAERGEIIWTTIHAAEDPLTGKLLIEFLQTELFMNIPAQEEEVTELKKAA